MLRYDHYKLLGIARDATQAQIKRAYRQRVKNCHPDINPSPRAATAFRAVHEAYRILSDVRQRSRYDHELRYYRQVHMRHEDERIDVKKYGHRRKPADQAERSTPAGAFDRAVFVGLHLTGLLFGLSLVSGILVGVTLHEWSPMTLVFSTFGIAVIPDSIAGLRRRVA